MFRGQIHRINVRLEVSSFSYKISNKITGTVEFMPHTSSICLGVREMSSYTSDIVVFTHWRSKSWMTQTPIKHLRKNLHLFAPIHCHKVYLVCYFLPLWKLTLKSTVEFIPWYPKLSISKPTICVYIFAKKAKHSFFSDQPPIWEHDQQCREKIISESTDVFKQYYYLKILQLQGNVFSAQRCWTLVTANVRAGYLQSLGCTKTRKALTTLRISCFPSNNKFYAQMKSNTVWNLN